MKLALVVQRYGPEVVGESELHCRRLAERLVAQHDVEVLTTCARDDSNWVNEYPVGADRVRGVTVRRFPTALTRDPAAFSEYSKWIFENPHTRADEVEWLKQHGPWCPALVDHLRRSRHQYDVLVFFTYVHATTVMGLEVSPGKSILVAHAHDEPALQLEIYKDVFRKPGAICYLTDSERQLIQGRFPDRPLVEEIAGAGVDIPRQQPYPGMPDPVDAEDDPDASDARRSEFSESLDEPPPPLDFPSHLLAKGSVFLRRHRLYGPVVLYGGRVDPGKGCEELIEYFEGYVKDGGEATLALMGAKLMSLPEEPGIRFAGMLSERERAQAFEAATVVACPSPNDGLSLLALEALAVGTPVLVNARNAGLVEHCAKSNGGLWYADRDEFVEALKLLIDDPGLAEALGRNGRNYVRKHHRWDVILGTYERTFAKIRLAK